MIAYLGFPPFVVTLGMLSIARSLAMVASNNTVVFQFGPDHDKLLALGGGSTFGIANPVLYMIVLALITGFVLRWTRFGRHVFAIGGNEHAATLTGVPVRRIKVAVYMISALSAGIAGIVQTGWLGAVTTNLGAGMELQVIAAAVIGGANLAGGIGTAFGALVGAALIEIIRNSLGLLGINAFWQGTFIGSFIIIAVAFDRLRRTTLRRVADARHLFDSLHATRTAQSGQRAESGKATASKGGTRTSSASLRAAISVQAPLRSSNASSVLAAGSTYQRWRTPWAP